MEAGAGVEDLDADESTVFPVECDEATGAGGEVDDDGVSAVVEVGAGAVRR